MPAIDTRSKHNRPERVRNDRIKNVYIFKDEIINSHHVARNNGVLNFKRNISCLPGLRAAVKLTLIN